MKQKKSTKPKSSPVRFEVSGASATLQAGMTQLWIGSWESQEALHTALSKFPNLLSLLKSKLKNISKDLKEKSPEEPTAIHLAFEGEGGVQILFLPPDLSTFRLHTVLRKTFASHLRAKNEGKTQNIAILIHDLPQLQEERVIDGLASLSLLSKFQVETFGKKQTKQKDSDPMVLRFASNQPKKQVENILFQSRILASGNNRVRHLAELPSNILNPITYRARLETWVKELKSEKLSVQMSFISAKDLKRLGAGAFSAVIQGDLNDRGGLLKLSYRGAARGGAGNKKKKRLALVGKGLCFDTGGYNVKTGDFMYNMHRDMTGSAVAASLFRACVESRLDLEIDCYLALAENLISHEAFRPNDVVIAKNGMSIEVIDTDAEGRMVLADTLCFASEAKPDLIVDFATLTGSVVRSLDTRRCGVYSNDLEVSSLAVKVGDVCGERLWNFPIGDDYQDALKSEIADTRQCASVASADHIYAATFLSQFVPKTIPWLHIDLAADTNRGGLGLVPTENTGFGVRWGYHFIQEFLLKK